MFEKNAEARVGVLNGYTGTVRAVAQAAIDIELDGGRMVRFDPKAYPHLDYGWATTTYKSQGRGDPLVVVGTLARNDDARSAHVALTRCETGLRVHTRLTRDELLEHLTLQASLRPKDDALLFEGIVRRTGGPDTFWAQAVRAALAKDADPSAPSIARKCACSAFSRRRASSTSGKRSTSFRPARRRTECSPSLGITACRSTWRNHGATGIPAVQAQLPNAVAAASPTSSRNHAWAGEASRRACQVIA